MRTFLIHTVAIAHKELLHFLRDYQAIYLALGLPLLLVVLFGYAVSFDMEEVPLAVVDHDRTARSRRLIHTLDAGDAFAVKLQIDDPAAADRLFRRERVRGVLVVPAGFARAIAEGRSAPLQLLLDGTDGTVARTALGYASGFVRAESLELLGGAGAGQAVPLEARIRTWFNPGSRSALFVVPGLVAFVLAILAVVLTALTVAREWERGSMEQLFATPVGRLPVVVGKLLPYMGLGLLQMLLVIAAGAWLFDVPLRGSFALLLLATFLFLMSVFGQGLLISVVTKNQQVATQIAAMSSLLPSMLLSGFLFPIENMARPLQWLSAAVPARYMITCLRGVLLQGRGIELLWPQLAGMCVLALLFVGASTLRFRRRLD